jgi:hypothetical protein
MINPSVVPQVNNLSAETRNFKTYASGCDFGNLFSDWSLAGQRHVAADVQLSSDASREILSMKFVKSVVKNTRASLPRITQSTRMNQRGHKRCSLPKRGHAWTSPHLPGKATGTSNMALSSEGDDISQHSIGKSDQQFGANN